MARTESTMLPLGTEAPDFTLPDPARGDVPDEPTRVTFEFQGVLHIFQRGHRIVVQVQSTWFPLADRNPGTWVDNIFLAAEDDIVLVTTRVHRTPEMPSHLRVGVLEE